MQSHLLDCILGWKLGENYTYIYIFIQMRVCICICIHTCALVTGTLVKRGQHSQSNLGFVPPSLENLNIPFFKTWDATCSVSQMIDMIHYAFAGAINKLILFCIGI
uniref:Uncharacterized protein n=1 Tax=Laticauda laticaudata TaxID=8630 RepID=A0A8C5RWX6_LATLA